MARLLRSDLHDDYAYNADAMVPIGGKLRRVGSLSSEEWEKFIRESE